MTKSFAGLSIYQVYPRSFYDSNGDGVGDLQGIREKLQYMADLNVDAVWISPFYRSPMKDFGYDVSDYRGVEPVFGTLEDFRELVSDANKLGLRVIIDQVLSHASNQHPWFIESASSRDNSKADWFVWTDGDKDTPPNNWLSIFGGSAWQWHEGRQQFYMHNFLVEQPDINMHNPDVQEALLDNLRFWLDMGVGGFRFDTLNFFFHDLLLRDDLHKPEGHKANNAPDVNPYGHYYHVHSINRPENIDFIERIRSLLDEYQAIGLGEVGSDNEEIRVIKEYTRGESRMHMCYGFELLGANDLIPKTFIQYMLHGREAGDSHFCHSMSNHDVCRSITRFGRDESEENQQEIAKMLLLILVSLKGSFCIYQGEELALTEAEIPYEKIQDPYGKTFYPKFKGRDGCRTPIVWQDDQPHGGFSKNSPDIEPWLPVPQEHLSHAVNKQINDSTSVLHWYRDVLREQKNNLVMREGEITMESINNILVIHRHLDDKKISSYLNLSPEPCELPDSQIPETILANNYQNGKFGPYGCVLVRE